MILETRASIFPMRFFVPIVALAVLLVPANSMAEPSAVPGQNAEQLDFFEKKIRPVLVEHCYECHAADAKTIQGGLTLDTAQGLLQGGDSGPALVPHQSDKSLLIQALRYESNEMPPRGKLPDNVIADFVAWVNAGAIDPRVGIPTPSKKKIDFEEARRFWSFAPPKMPPIPTTKRTGWAESDIDRFVLAALEQHRLTPVAPANRRALIRRASFDLTGLPPTPAEVESFLADSSPDAFATVIDRLLRSEAYGERWGRYWLDVARYSEDQAHGLGKKNPSGYRFRDWVITAFNDDMPFDRFIRYQIAADVMEIDEADRMNNLAALGYFGLGAQYYKLSDAAKAAADELDDRVDTLTRGFLGLTVSCARCHDHKFDPIPQQDYYSLAGVFHSSRLHDAPLVSSAEVDRFNAAQEKIKKLEESINHTIAAEGPKIREARIADVARYMVATQRFQQAKAKNGSLTLAQFAKGEELEEGTLKRWLEFLESKSASPPKPLKPWFKATASGTSAAPARDAAISSAARGFQNHLALLIREVGGQLTSEEQSKLATQKEHGDPRFISPKVTRDQPTASIDVDLNGAKELILVVGDGGNGANCDAADWLEPKLVTASGEIPLTDLKWRSATATFGEVKLNANLHGKPLRVAGKSYPNGIGTHSTSVITYDLPEGARRFRAIGGLDNSGSDQGGDCGANARIQFRVYTETPADKLGQADLLATVFGEKGLFSMSPQELEKRLADDIRATLVGRRRELEQLRREAPEMYPVAHVIAESNPSDMKVMVRGNPANQGEPAPRRFLKVLSPDAPQPFSKGSGRLELADAIASRDNPLTARVIVNRVWQHHFGRGLVGTPDNFGKLGEPPSHPELLDYLTVRFIEGGWSLKSLHREIMLSATYRLGTDRDESNMQRDADNRYLWRMNRRRLDLEAWRDAVLATSGRLDRTLRGPSTNLSDAGNNRRTVYAFISRHDPDNMLRLFDFPDANITASTRTETTVPQQQLFVLNSPFMIEQSKAFAARVQKEAGPNLDDQIRMGYTLAFGRPASDRELQLAMRYVQADESEEEKKHNKLTRLERYAQALLGSNEFMYVD